MENTSESLPKNAPSLAVLGGNLQEPLAIKFAQRLGATIATETSLRICVSGYKGKLSTDSPESFSPSFGYCVAQGAAEVLEEEGTKSRLVTRIISSLRDSPNFFKIGTVVIAKGRKTLSRQLSLVVEADLVCLAGGKKGTTEIFHFARGIDKPVLPLPFLGDAARNMWFSYQNEIKSELRLTSADFQRWSSFKLSQLSSPKSEDIILSISKALVGAVRRRCLVCMPFARHFDWVWDRIIEPAANTACMDLVRIDFEQNYGDIAKTFRGELAASDCVIAVVTGGNANVLYEVGFAHALGKEVLLLSQVEDSTSQVKNAPFYLRTHRTVRYPPRFNDEEIERATNEICNIFCSIRQGPETGQNHETSR